MSKLAKMDSEEMSDLRNYMMSPAWNLSDLQVGSLSCILLSSCVCSSYKRYLDLFSILRVDKDTTLNIYFPESGNIKNVIVRTIIDNFKNFLNENDNVSDLYFYIEEQFIGYNSLRDDFSFIMVSNEVIAPGIMQQWDQEFIDHVRCEGVGFGDEGKKYVSKIISYLNEDRRTNISCKLEP